MNHPQLWNVASEDTLRTLFDDIKCYSQIVIKTYCESQYVFIIFNAAHFIHSLLGY